MINKEISSQKINGASKPKNMYVCTHCKPKNVFGKLKIMKKHAKEKHSHIPYNKRDFFEIIKVFPGSLPSFGPSEVSVQAQSLASSSLPPPPPPPSYQSTKKEIEVKTMKRTYDHGTYQDQFLKTYHIADDDGGDYYDEDIDDDNDDEDAEEDEEDSDDYLDGIPDDNTNSRSDIRLHDIFFQRDKSFSHNGTPHAKSATLLGDKTKDQASSWGLLDVNIYDEVELI